MAHSGNGHDHHHPHHHGPGHGHSHQVVGPGTVHAAFEPAVPGHVNGSSGPPPGATPLKKLTGYG